MCLSSQAVRKSSTSGSHSNEIGSSLRCRSLPSITYISMRSIAQLRCRLDLSLFDLNGYL